MLPSFNKSGWYYCADGIECVHLKRQFPNLYRLFTEMKLTIKYKMKIIRNKTKNSIKTYVVSEGIYLHFWLCSQTLNIVRTGHWAMCLQLFNSFSICQNALFQSYTILATGIISKFECRIFFLPITNIFSRKEQNKKLCLKHGRWCSLWSD